MKRVADLKKAREEQVVSSSAPKQPEVVTVVTETVVQATREPINVDQIVSAQTIHV